MFCVRGDAESSHFYPANYNFWLELQLYTYRPGNLPLHKSKKITSLSTIHKITFFFPLFAEALLFLGLFPLYKNVAIKSFRKFLLCVIKTLLLRPGISENKFFSDDIFYGRSFQKPRKVQAHFAVFNYIIEYSCLSIHGATTCFVYFAVLGMFLV